VEPDRVCRRRTHTRVTGGISVSYDPSIWHRPLGSAPIPEGDHSAPGEVLVKGLHLFVRGFLFKAGVVHRDRLTADVKAAYLAPHPTWSSRTPILEFPREIPAGPEGPVSDLNAEIESGLEEYFRSKPVRIVWAMKDIAFTPEMVDQLWLRTFPDAEVTRIDDAGHYLQEDAHERIVPALIEFLG
jgi:haloalkane dehalogenase